MNIKLEERMIDIAKQAIDLNKQYQNKINFYNPEIQLVTSTDDLIEIFKLRYLAFEKRGYNVLLDKNIREFEYNFDDFDSTSLNFRTFRNNTDLVSASRIILDIPEKGLLSEKKYDSKYGFEKLRTKNQHKNKGIVEASRTVINPEKQGSPIELRDILVGAYTISKQLNVGSLLTVISSDDLKYYSRMGMEVIKEIPDYDNLKKPSLILEWDIENPSSLFDKLKKKSYKLKNGEN